MDLGAFWSGIRESSKLRSDSRQAGNRQMSTGHLHLDGFDSQSVQNKDTTPTGWCPYFGAGYGNRTRDRCLGSDCFAIKLILQNIYLAWQIAWHFRKYCFRNPKSHWYARIFNLAVLWLRKPLYYRYTNPACGGIIAKDIGKFNHNLSMVINGHMPKGNFVKCGFLPAALIWFRVSSSILEKPLSRMG